jgi:catechol 2,3-dioxygenase-like lactoylglutathione lyase family enzyme
MALDIQGVCTLLQVFDMPTSLAFYRDVLGFGIVERSQPVDNCGWAWLRRDDTDLMLNTAYEDDARPTAPDVTRVASHDDTTLFFGCRDVDAAYDYLHAHGLDVAEPKVTWYGMKQLYVKDPDGYNLCFQWRADTRAAATYR